MDGPLNMYNTFTVHFLYYFFYGSDPTARCTMVKDWRNSALLGHIFMGFQLVQFSVSFIMTPLNFDTFTRIADFNLIFYQNKLSIEFDLTANLNMNFKSLLRRVFN